MEIIIHSEEEEVLKKVIHERKDQEAARLSRFLSLKDLSRTPGSPLNEIVNRTLKVKNLKNFDTIQIPEIIAVDVLFDLFNMPPGHPARSTSDTYYVDNTHVLRTHDTVFWYYYLRHSSILDKIKKQE